MLDEPFCRYSNTLSSGSRSKSITAPTPARADAIRARLTTYGVTPATEVVTRFVVHWETDANDVDLHVWDAAGNAACYHQPTLPTGGALLADITGGATSPAPNTLPKMGVAPGKAVSCASSTWPASVSLIFPIE